MNIGALDNGDKCATLPVFLLLKRVGMHVDSNVFREAARDCHALIMRALAKGSVERAPIAAPAAAFHALL